MRFFFNQKKNKTTNIWAETVIRLSSTLRHLCSAIEISFKKTEFIQQIAFSSFERSRRRWNAQYRLWKKLRSEKNSEQKNAKIRTYNYSAVSCEMIELWREIWWMKAALQTSEMFKTDWSLRQNTSRVNNSSNWTLNAVVRNDVKIELNKTIDALTTAIIDVYNTPSLAAIDVYTAHRFSPFFIFHFTLTAFIKKAFIACNFITAFIVTFWFQSYSYCYCACSIQILFSFELYRVLQATSAFFSNFCFDFSSFHVLVFIRDCDDVDCRSSLIFISFFLTLPQALKWLHFNVLKFDNRKTTTIRTTSLVSRCMMFQYR